MKSKECDKRTLDKRKEETEEKKGSTKAKSKRNLNYWMLFT
jgi:hypothetical protein